MNFKKFLGKVIVIDASVLLKAFKNEDGSVEVNQLLKHHLDKELTLLSSTLLHYEILNVFAKTLAKLEIAQIAFEYFNELGIGLIDLDKNAAHYALVASSKNKEISYYDASYHALARSFEAIFLTADIRYYKAMKNEGNIELFC